MKKSWKKMTVACVMIIVVLTGCVGCSSNENTGETMKYQRFAVVEDGYYGDGFLVYDKNTLVMYYESTTSYFCPYYSENGNMCRYIDGEIVEIVK